MESTWRVADVTEGSRRFGKSTRCREDASRRRSGTPGAIRSRMQHSRPGPRGVRTPCYPRRPVVFPGAPGSRDYRNPLGAHGAVLPVQRRTCPRVPWRAGNEMELRAAVRFRGGDCGRKWQWRLRDSGGRDLCRTPGYRNARRVASHECRPRPAARKTVLRTENRNLREESKRMRNAPQVPPITGGATKRQREGPQRQRPDRTPENATWSTHPLHTWEKENRGPAV